MPWVFRAILRGAWLVFVLLAAWDAWRNWPLSFAWWLLTLGLSVAVLLFSFPRLDTGRSAAPAYAAAPPGWRGIVHGLGEILLWLARHIGGVGVRSRLVFGGSATVAATLLGVALQLQGFRPRDFDQAPPRHIDNPLEARHFAELRRYARELPYDTSTTDHLSRVARDRQFLALHNPQDPDSESPGPLALIVPVVNSHLNRLRDLEGFGNGQGRVVAMVEVEAPGYAPLGLPAGRSYIFIDSFRRGNNTARAIIIPDNPTDTVARAHPYPVRYHNHRRQWQHHARARWIWQGHHCANMDGCPHGCCDMCDRA